MRTSNSIERLNREIKRRTRVVSIFPNEAALLRLATAVLMERAGAAMPRDQPAEFKADHPFLFFIRDHASGMVLFMGRVASPES